MKPKKTSSELICPNCGQHFDRCSFFGTVCTKCLLPIEPENELEIVKENREKFEELKAKALKRLREQIRGEQ